MGSSLVAAIRVEHGVTGELLGPIQVEIGGEPWSAWNVAYRKGHALLVVDEDRLHEQAAQTPVDVRLIDPELLALIVGAESAREDRVEPLICNAATGCGLALEPEVGVGESAPVGPAPTHSNLVGRLTVERPEPGRGREHVVRLDPAPMTLEIALVDEHGHPQEGATIEIRGRDGAPPVTLTKVDWACVNSPATTPGLYRSCPPRAWDARYYPFQVVVDGMRVADRSMNYRKHVTRHRLVTPRNLRENE